MKKYLLKLAQKDLENYKGSLAHWHTMEQRFKDNNYQIKRKKMLEKKITTIERYIERISIKLK